MEHRQATTFENIAWWPVEYLFTEHICAVALIFERLFRVVQSPNFENKLT